MEKKPKKAILDFSHFEPWNDQPWKQEVFKLDNELLREKERRCSLRNRLKTAYIYGKGEKKYPKNKLSREDTEYIKSITEQIQKSSERISKIEEIIKNVVTTV